MRDKTKIYILQALLVLIFLYIYSSFTSIYDISAKKFAIPQYYHFISFFLCLMIGAAWGADSLISTFGYKGKFFIDHKRLIILGLPALLLSFNWWFSSFFSKLPVFYLDFIRIIPYFRVFLGYILITSLKRELLG